MKNWSDPNSDPIADLLSANKEFHSKQKIFQIWREGYSISGNESKAKFLGFVQAETFHEAVLKYYQGKPSATFDQHSLRDWGMRHFDNEQDARKSFG